MTVESISFFVMLSTYANYAVLMFFGYIREFFRNFQPDPRRATKKGFAPLLRDFEDFYTRRLYTRIQDCWNRPICSVPGAYIDVMVRDTKDYNKTLTLNGDTIRALNLASYNYLGFASNRGSPTVEAVLDSLHTYGVSTASPRLEAGTTRIHDDVEKLTARYLGKEDALIFGMGFATNSTTIPALVGKGSLIISDSLNHSSLVVGARSSGAKIKVFKHNDLAMLESILRESISEGQPRTHRPWKKIIILVEGIYSMEGEILDLPGIVALKKKYKCYLYVDEAHSIGALGATGRGICEHHGVNVADIDILMGTFTKSFASVGGYVAGSRELVSFLKRSSWGSLYATSMAPACAQQIISSLSIIMGEDRKHPTLGQEKIRQLRENSNFFRIELEKRGFQVVGSPDSPIVPVMLYNPSKMPAFSRECLKRGLASVVVGFPATSLIESRVRFCISADHTHEDLVKALGTIDEVGDLTMIKYLKNHQQSAMNSAP